MCLSQAFRNSWDIAGSRALRPMCSPMINGYVPIIMPPVRRSKGGSKMCPPHAATTLAERYDMALHYARDDRLPADARRPLPTGGWPKENLEFLARYQDWLLGGGVSEMVTSVYHIIMAGHVFGLTLKPYHELDPDRDLECALEYVQAKGLSAEWIKNCRNSLIKFRRFLRLQRGLGEESRIASIDVSKPAQGLPEWLVSELGHYQKILQRNWGEARHDLNLRA